MFANLAGLGQGNEPNPIDQGQLWADQGQLWAWFFYEFLSKLMAGVGYS
ncbi:MAG: hypothetical protein ACXV74_09870 [Methylobacter sp.]